MWARPRASLPTAAVVVPFIRHRYTAPPASGSSVGSTLVFPIRPSSLALYPPCRSTAAPLSLLDQDVQRLQNPQLHACHFPCPLSLTCVPRAARPARPQLFMGRSQNGECICWPDMRITQLNTDKRRSPLLL